MWGSGFPTECLEGRVFWSPQWTGSTIGIWAGGDRKASAYGAGGPSDSEGRAPRSALSVVLVSENG